MQPDNTAKSLPCSFSVAILAAALATIAQTGRVFGDDTKQLRIEDIRIRDPFIVTDTKAGRYYMYANKSNRGAGPGWECYVSNDLLNWDPPVTVFSPPEGFWGQRDFWAPEVHAYQGKYYLFATLSAENAMRGTQIFVSQSPLGPFVPHSDKAATPHNWMALDGTLFMEDGTPWMVFCHEWVQIDDGTINALRLSNDLRRTVGEPLELLRASDAPWTRPIRNGAYVTDGPWLHRLPSGKLIMLWSSFGEGDYTVGVARSESNMLRGPWQHVAKPLIENGGHCMMFRTLQGRLLLLLHSPNQGPHERARFFNVRETQASVELTPLDRALEPVTD